MPFNILYAGIDWLQSFLQLFFFFVFFFHSLSIPVAVFVSLIPFHCFTTVFSTTGHNLIIISCTSLYTFENTRENDRKIESGDRLTQGKISADDILK